MQRALGAIFTVAASRDADESALGRLLKQTQSLPYQYFERLIARSYGRALAAARRRRDGALRPGYYPRRNCSPRERWSQNNGAFPQEGFARSVPASAAQPPLYAASQRRARCDPLGTCAGSARQAGTGGSRECRGDVGALGAATAASRTASSLHQGIMIRQRHLHRAAIRVALARRSGCVASNEERTTSFRAWGA